MTKTGPMRVITNFTKNTVQSLFEMLGAMPPYTGMHAEVFAVAESALNTTVGETDTMAALIRGPDVEGKGEIVSAQFITWRSGREDPLRLLMQMLDVVRADAGIADDHPLAPSMMMAAFLASVPSALPFHSHHHAREVTFLACVLGLAAKIPAQDMAELFIASCIHDFAHDGQGNRRLDKYTPMRLENKALVAAEPFLKAAGITEASWQRVRAMVLATDVSKGYADDISPAEWLRLAHEGQALDASCPENLKPLFTEKNLAHNAALLEDADLGTSAAMPYAYARRMTALIAEETRVLSPTPQTLIGFIDHICHGGFISDIAQKLFGNAMKAVRAQAEQESANTIYHWS